MKSDVIVVGGSFIGLSTAIILARSGISVSLLDTEDLSKREDANELGRLFAIASDTLSIFHRAFDTANIMNKSQPINRVRVVDSESSAKVDFSPEEMNEGRKSFGYMIREADLREELLREMSNNDKIRVYRVGEIISLVNRPDEAAIKIKNTTGDEKNISARLIIGCDGKNSKVRRFLGIRSTKTDFKQIGIVCEIEHKNCDHNGVAVEKFYSSGPFAILPKHGGYESAIVWSCDDTVKETLKHLSPQLLESLISHKLNGYLGPINIKNGFKTYPIAEIKAEEVFKGRAVLLGDAAHSIHPIAGQGLNLGMRGVGLLTDMIVEAYQLGIDFGGAPLLSRYAQKRKLDDALMGLATRGANSIFLAQNPLIKRGRRLGMKLLNSSRFVKRIVMKYATGDSTP